ncbi:ABC transporter ATP-binding protein [Streptomyces sp. D2-8]|uniref:ABC transporter ATP-binding protein n=1 Tax=Streptomyces sp. D2-8 TaxID=2707767 RepID=UPI0020BD8759|nr:ABC transporter ATP-binding protein [Streptomyces sp. D2-8]MCK8434234.1 ABC transporter ATP-binding protein [Streptomyces sp. D2-8]
MTAIDIHGLRRTYGTHSALQGIDLTVPAGSLTALVGPNGSGKTTTMRLLLGLDRPDAGSGTVLGEPLERPASYLPRVGALIEQPALYRRLTGRANLRVLAELGSTDPRRVDEVLELTGMSPYADRPVAGYSLGMRQRIGVAGALLTEPRLMILDEPTNGLDPVGTAQLRSLLTTLAADGVTVLISSHQLNELDTLCDHFVFLDRGRVLFAGDRAGLTAAQGPLIEAVPECSGDLPALLRAVEATGRTAHEAGGLLLTAAPADWAPALNRIAAEHGITLAHLAVRRPSLEEAFFTLTERHNTRTAKAA